MHPLPLTLALLVALNVAARAENQAGIRADYKLLYTQHFSS